MERMVRDMLEMLDRAVDAIGAWVRGGADDLRVLDPSTWSVGFTVLVVVLVVLLALAVWRGRQRSPLATRHPEILVTRGELMPDGAGRSADAGTLTMTVSNLSRYPVQVLEVAVRTARERRFGVTEVSALVPAMGEVDIETRVPVGRLDDGVLDVYVYAAATRVKTYRHRAELVWEPWSKRFKVAPLEQQIRPARTLPSARQDVFRLPEDVEPPGGIWVAPAARTAPPPRAPERAVPAPPAPARTRPARSDSVPDPEPLRSWEVETPPPDSPPRAAAAPGGDGSRRRDPPRPPMPPGIERRADRELRRERDLRRRPLERSARAIEDVELPPPVDTATAAPPGAGGETDVDAPRLVRGPEDLFALLGETPTRVAAPRPIAPSPAPTPAQVAELHELLVTDRDVATPRDGAVSTTAADDDVTPRPAGAGHGHEGPPVAAPQGDGEPRSDRRAPPEEEPAPRRQRGVTPLEFPEDF